jgi:hypothetical protein
MTLQSFIYKILEDAEALKYPQVAALCCWMERDEYSWVWPDRRPLTRGTKASRWADILNADLIDLIHEDADRS